jgi:hypothetical protein
MSLKWPAKDPEEILNYSVDWSRFLNGETLISAQWYVYTTEGVKTAIAPGGTVEGLTLQSIGNTTTVATAKFSGGTVNRDYKIGCQITFGATSLVAERSVILPIKER